MRAALGSLSWATGGHGEWREEGRRRSGWREERRRRSGWREERYGRGGDEDADRGRRVREQEQGQAERKGVRRKGEG